jgi:hypothetical protein
VNGPSARRLTSEPAEGPSERHDMVARRFLGPKSTRWDPCPIGVGVPVLTWAEGPMPAGRVIKLRYGQRDGQRRHGQGDRSHPVGGAARVLASDQGSRPPVACTRAPRNFVVNLCRVEQSPTDSESRYSHRPTRAAVYNCKKPSCTKGECVVNIYILAPHFKEASN